MARFLGILLILALIVAGVGLFMGWFSVSTEKDSQGTDIHIRVNTDQINEDKEKVKQKVENLSDRAERKVENATKE